MFRISILFRGNIKQLMKMIIYILQLILSFITQYNIHFVVNNI